MRGPDARLTAILVIIVAALAYAQDGPPTNNANILTRVDTDNHLVVAAEIRDPNTTTQKAAVSASGALKVECASGCAAGSGMTDAEYRAVQVSTGTIDANGESVTLALNGARGASASFTNNSFDGTVRFYTSNNGSTFYEAQAHETFTGQLVNREQAAGTNPTRLWSIVLWGGETHVRVTSVSYTSGSLDVRWTATNTPSNPVAAAISNNGDTQRAIGSMAIAGSRSTGHYPISANSGSELLSDVGLIVRNVTAVQADGSSAGGAAYRSLVAGADPDDNAVRTLHLDTEAPSGTENGLIVRNIPSGTQAVSGTVAATQSGTWTVQPGNTANTTAWLVKEVRASSSSQTSVNDSAANVTILASNAARLGATIWNDSSAALKVKLGATASSTSYTVRIASGGYYEVPFGYTGIIDGIWETDPNDGAARVTEVN